VSFTSLDTCAAGPSNLVGHGVGVKPLGWSGVVSPSSSGLDFEADPTMCHSNIGALLNSATALKLYLLPHGPDSMITAGESAFERGDYAAAARDFQQAFNANPKSYVALHNLALANAKLGNSSLAKSQLSRALSMAQSARDAAAAKAIGASIGSLGG
jgi:tetratricopeptide (TPR) repeat protein